jgi:hypothetical protein
MTKSRRRVTSSVFGLVLCIVTTARAEVEATDSAEPQRLLERQKNPTIPGISPGPESSSRGRVCAGQCEVLHDGRTTDRGVAIQAHSGQAAAAATAFNVLTSAQKSDLLSFLGTL